VEGGKRGGVSQADRNAVEVAPTGVSGNVGKDLRQREKTMELGALIPWGDIGGTPGAVRDYAQAAEAAGYHFIEAPDHVLGAREGDRTGSGL
jgi:hypothetical protein